MAVLPGCSTVSTPVLRHETAEALGFGNFRVWSRVELGRSFPAHPPGSPATGVPQEDSAFKSGFIGVGASAGVGERTDVQAGTFFSPGGAGWRLGFKWQFLKRGNFSVGSMLGYGRFSAKGDATYLTADYPVTVTQTLTASTWDLSIPVSYRFSPSFAVYTGAAWFNSQLSGSADTTGFRASLNDLAFNFGLKLTLDRFEPDVEVAFVQVGDPFTNRIRTVPYFGVSAAILF